MPGPAPKRDAERVRSPEPASGAARHGELRPVSIPNADRKNWHPRAIAWYDSLKTSGQQDYYQDSDWQTAKIICDYLTLWYERPRAMDMANIFAMMGRLGSTEGDRRQILRVELDAPVVEDKSASLIAIEGYKAKLSQKSG
jgi:hypothetical protein